MDESGRWQSVETNLCDPYTGLVLFWPFKSKFVYIAELIKKLEIDIRYMSVRQKSRAMKFESPPVLRLRQNELNAVNNTWLTRF